MNDVAPHGMRPPGSLPGGAQGGMGSSELELSSLLEGESTSEDVVTAFLSQFRTSVNLDIEI